MQVIVAAVAMVGTFPGRTQALGIITESVLADFHLTPSEYATISLWATLFGALAAIGLGQLIDRCGVRLVTTLLALSLGLTSIGLARAHGVAALAVLLTLSRALGQSALSVASLSITPRWFARRLPLAMAVFSIILSILFAVAFMAATQVRKNDGWRTLWTGVGWSLILILAPASAFILRRGPESCGLVREPESPATLDAPPSVSWTLPQALRSSTFWAMAFGSALYALISAGVGLFNEAIFLEWGFSVDDYGIALGVTAFASLVGNFLAGWLAGRFSLTKLMSFTLGLISISLVAFLFVHSRAQLYAQSATMGLASGFVMVLFFAIWGRAFGPKHVGTIQGAAQAMTVLASAIGPIVFSAVHDQTHSYYPIFWGLAIIVALVGTWCGAVQLPDLSSPAIRNRAPVTP